MSNQVSLTAYKAQVGWGREKYMFSRQNDIDCVRDREKLSSSDVIILFWATNLVLSSSFYDAWFGCKLHFPGLNQTHLVLFIF